MTERTLIDDCFYVEAKKWGTWGSYDRDGKSLITSLTEQTCINATRYYMKGLQEGFGETTSYQGSVDGKL